MADRCDPVETWSCETCTYLHAEERELGFLSCAVCGTARQKEGSSNSSSSSPPPPPVRKRERSESEDATQKKKVVLKSLPSLPISVRVGGVEKHITDEELQDYAPITLVRKALPPALADALLRLMLNDSGQWHRGRWTVFGKTHDNARTTRTFALGSGSTTTNEYSEESEEGENRDADRSCHPAPRELREAAGIIAEIVRSVSYMNFMLMSKKANPWVEWVPTFAFGNHYTGGSEGVGWHSDFLLSIGPRPIIAGLNLGATRKFDVRSEGTVVSLPTPHNSLIVMRADCQENWQHSVPKLADSSIRRHNASLSRFNLTFRMERPELRAQHQDRCDCDKPAALKSKAGYYYLCCNPRGGEAAEKCGFHRPCAWAQREADRLKKLQADYHK